MGKFHLVLHPAAIAVRDDEPGIFERGPDLGRDGGDQLDFLAGEGTASGPIGERERANHVWLSAGSGIADRHGEYFAWHP